MKLHIMYNMADDKLLVTDKLTDEFNLIEVTYLGQYKASEICDAFVEYFGKGIQTTLDDLDFKAKEDTSFNFGANVPCQ